jgi:DNA-binding transcriptional MerR regulator
MSPSALTIGQLAAHVGVTARAVRHYHSRGLLPEPARDASGYRRYDAQAVVDLIRIKTLADAGVPLARIRRLLDASPEDFAAAIATIDRTLRARIRDLKEHQRRLAELAHGERLFLPDDIVEMLDHMRAIGVSERSVQMERDGWILMASLSPEVISRWVDTKRKALADPEFQRLYLASDEALDWDPDDPRLHELAARMADWTARHRDADADASEQTVDVSVGTGLINAHVASASPAWRRLGDMARAARRGESRQ